MPDPENDAAARPRPPSDEADAGKQGDDLGPPSSEASIVKLVAAHQVVVGVLGLATIMSSVSRVPQTLAYGAETGQLPVVLLNVAIVLAFLGAFVVALAGGVQAWRQRPGRLARLLPLLLIAQSPVLAAPGFQYYLGLLPPQVGVMVLPNENIRVGLLFELSARVNLAFDDEVTQQLIMVNVLPLALLWVAVYGARDSVLFPQSATATTT